jgi:hypothetical protein
VLQIQNKEEISARKVYLILTCEKLSLQKNGLNKKREQGKGNKSSVFCFIMILACVNNREEVRRVLNIVQWIFF